MRAWLGQDDAGNPIGIVYYGTLFTPSYCVWIIPGTDGYDTRLSAHDAD